MVKTTKNIVLSVVAFILYVLIYSFFYYILTLISDIKLWGSIEQVIKVKNYEVLLIDAIYFIIGAVFFVHGVLRLIGINKQNHQARDEKTRLPIKLLTNGYYGKVRHPMYGVFMLIQAGIMFSTRSIFCLCIASLIIIVQIFNGIIEEKSQLIKIFNNDYEEYKNKVKARYLTPQMKVYFIIAVILSILGIVYM